MKLSDCVKVIVRGIKPDYADSNNFLIGQTCVRNNTINMDAAKSVKSITDLSKCCQYGDIIVNSLGVGSLGRVAQVHFDSDTIAPDHNTLLVRPIRKYSEFIGCSMMLREDEIENLAEGSTGQTHLYPDDLSELSFNLPDDDVLLSFSRVARTCYLAIENNKQEQAKLRSIRDYLLPKLMSGEIGVSNLKIPTKYSFSTASSQHEQDDQRGSEGKTEGEN